MSIEILIDGYNLINKWDILKDKFTKEPENAREFLIEILHHYKRLKHHKIKVVFDAYNSFSLIPSKFSAKGITVIFTPMGETADSFIKKSVSSNGEKYVVVTSDNEIKQFVNAHGALSLNSEDFIAKLEFAFYLDSKGMENESDDVNRRISTRKKGNPRKLPKKMRKNLKKFGKL